jgi:hypothetical protein
MYELPLEPDNDSHWSYNSKNNFPYWVEFRKKAFAFIWRWGVPYCREGLVSDAHKDVPGPYYATPEMLAMGWGRSSINLEFGSGGSLAASNIGSLSTETLRTNSSPTDGNNWLHWDHRGAIFTAITGSSHWVAPNVAFPKNSAGKNHLWW